MDISHIVYSDIEPRGSNILWLKPTAGGGISLYLQDDGWKPLRIVSDKHTYTVYDDTVIDVEGLKEKTNGLIDSMYYKDLYIGVGADVQSILITSNHFSVLKKGTKFSYSTANGYLFVLLSSNATPTVLMSSLQVPMEQGEDITVGGKTYHVWSSESIYSGNINIVLL